MLNIAKLKELYNNKQNTKHAIYFFLIVLITMLLAQLISQLYSVDQLNKITGNVIKVNTAITSYTFGSKNKKSVPVYSHIITFNDDTSYIIPQSVDVAQGDKLILYYPPALYRVLTLDFLDYENYPLQMVVNSSVVINFASHKTRGWKFCLYLLGGIGLFCYLLYDWHRS
ncbi:hypothetical protein ABIB62_000166 [Mucilaginibacter sp. UYP25]|uniref:hypothetical protein n=1 Tax=unclassified Mucilaginibacter TaxID=2617802 RepID=UPI00339362BF